MAELDDVQAPAVDEPRRQVVGIRIEAPDAFSGFALVQRLGERCALTGSELDGWIVSGSPTRSLESVLSTIQQWLEDHAIDRVTVHLGDRSHTMTLG